MPKAVHQSLPESQPRPIHLNAASHVPKRERNRRLAKRRAVVRCVGFYWVELVVRCLTTATEVLASMGSR